MSLDAMASKYWCLQWNSQRNLHCNNNFVSIVFWKLFKALQFCKKNSNLRINKWYNIFRHLSFYAFFWTFCIWSVHFFNFTKFKMVAYLFFKESFLRFGDEILLKCSCSQTIHSFTILILFHNTFMFFVLFCIWVYCI